MALTVNLLNRTSTSITAAQTLTSGSFTPTANATLYTFAAVGGAASAQTPAVVAVTDTDTRTWTLISQPTATHSFGAGFGQFAYCASAAAGAAPVSMTVTLDPYSTTGTAYMTMIVVEVVGTHTEVQHNQDSQSGATASETLTLSVAATSGNLVLALFDANVDTPFVAMGAITDWTAVSNPTGTSYATCSLFSNSLFSSTSVTEATLGNSLSHRGGIILELVESGGGGGSPSVAIASAFNAIPFMAPMVSAT